MTKITKIENGVATIEGKQYPLTDIVKKYNADTSTPFEAEVKFQDNKISFLRKTTSSQTAKPKYVTKKAQTKSKLHYKDENYVTELMKLEAPTEKKMGLTYISWADAWAQVKVLFPDANYEVHCNESGMPYFKDDTCAFTKVSVTINDVTHRMQLPILDNRNKPVKPENLESFVVNKSIMRTLAKAIAMHGLGMYVYRGEDLPEEQKR